MDPIILATPPPTAPSHEDWTSLMECPGWKAIVLPFLAEKISSLEQVILTTHQNLTDTELRTHLIQQSSLRQFVSGLEDRAREAFRHLIQPEVGLAEIIIKRAFALPTTFQIAVQPVPGSTPSTPPLEPADFGQEPNPFAGAVKARPIAPPDPEPAPPPPPETPTP